MRHAWSRQSSFRPFKLFGPKFIEYLPDRPVASHPSFWNVQFTSIPETVVSPSRYRLAVRDDLFNTSSESSKRRQYAGMMFRNLEWFELVEVAIRLTPVAQIPHAFLAQIQAALRHEFPDSATGDAPPSERATTPDAYRPLVYQTWAQEIIRQHAQMTGDLGYPEGGNAPKRYPVLKVRSYGLVYRIIPVTVAVDSSLEAQE